MIVELFDMILLAVFNKYAELLSIDNLYSNSIKI